MGTIAKRASILLGGFLVLILSLSLTTIAALAAPLTKVPVTVTQPDGTQVALFASGDEYYNWLHDAQGYTIMQDPVTGYYVYADLLNGELVPTKLVAGRDQPAGLRPHLNIAPEKREAIRQEFLDNTAQATGGIKNAPTTGTITNLVVFIRFAGESEFTDPTSLYTDMLNDPTAGADSLRSYYQEVSYGALTINSNLYPTPPAGTVVSYQDSHPRGYYQPWSVTNTIGYSGGNEGTQRRVREHTLLQNAVNYVNGLDQFSLADTIDGDGDGYVDSMMFVVQGGTTAWASLLWPHQWVLYSYPVQIHGKYVWEYSFQVQSMMDTGVLAHETFHVLGAPDLYHYYTSGTPAGYWDLMEYDQDPPQHMSCYMKYKYGQWISSIPTLAPGSTYSVNALTSSTNNCFKIPSPYSANEYFVTEYRKATGTFESSLPGSGLLVWRIDTRYDGNAYGPPDEVYVYRPGGTTSSTGNVYLANFSSDVARTRINDGTNPTSFLQNGSPGGLDICNVGSAAGASISFDLGGTCQTTTAFTSTGSQDGWILESAETSTTGGTLNAKATTLRLGDQVGREQYRAILSFPTNAALPDTAVVTKVTLSLRRQSVTPLGTNPFGIFQGMYVEVRKGYFGTGAALQAADFQSAPSRVTVGAYKPALAGGVYTINLPRSTWARVNALGDTGVTQLRLRFKLDDNNDSIANFISFYSGNYSDSNFRPTLTITYYVP